VVHRSPHVTLILRYTVRMGPCIPSTVLLGKGVRATFLIDRIRITIKMCERVYFVGSMNCNENGMLLSIVIRFSHSKAANLWYKLFAYHCITKDSHEIVPDYMTLVQKVYNDVVNVCLNKDQTMEIICIHH
jgi:hypothetical protein